MAQYYRYSYPMSRYRYPRYKQTPVKPAEPIKDESENKVSDICNTDAGTVSRKLPDFFSLIAEGRLDRPLIKLFNFPIFLDDIILGALILLLIFDDTNNDIILIFLVFLLIVGKDFNNI